MITLISEKRVDRRLLILAEKALRESKLEYQSVFYEDGESSISECLKKSKAALCFPGRWLSDDVIRDNKQIVIYQMWSSGVDKFNTAACIDNKIKVNNNGGRNAQSVAEHTLMLMLGCSRKLIEMTKRARNGNWSGNCQGAEMQTLNGKTLLVIGGGNIGSKVAKLAIAFGMSVNISDPIEKPELKKLGVEYVKIKDGLQKADIVTLHLHYNETTHNIINKQAIELMKDKSIIINVSRSQLIDKNCVDLIKKKRIRLGIDVYDKEPTSGYEQCFEVEQSIFTPHTAGSTSDAIYKCIEYCITNVKKAINDEAFDYVL